MNIHWQSVGLIATLGIAGCLVGWATPSVAQQENSILTSDAAPQGTAAEPQLIPAVPTTPVPGPLPDGGPVEELATPDGAVKVHPVAHIDYDITRRARKRFAGSPFVDLTMVTQNPADGCFYEIPLCLPACCTGEPQVRSYCGLFGRGVVVYYYECGLEIEVKFRLRGDVEVEYGT